MPGALTYPLGGTTVSGRKLTVDMLVQSPTVITQTINDMVAANQGWFADQLLSMPAMTIQGGAVLYQEEDPDDHFLSEGQGLAPRAPGAESPLIGVPDEEYLVEKVQSLAGKFEVTDDARRYNLIDGVQKAMRRIANSFAYTLQLQAITQVEAYLTQKSRVVSGVDWTATATGGVANIDPATLPQRDFGLARMTFEEDKTGVQPNLVILNSEDAFRLDLLYADKLDAMLARYGLAMQSSPFKAKGSAMFIERQSVGFIGFEKPLSSEQGRGPTGTWKDIFAVEAKPVVVTNNAFGGLLVTGISS